MSLLLDGTLVFRRRFVIVGDPRRGSQAEVYRAREVNLNREVALKVIPPTAELTSAVWVERLRHEAALQAKLNRSDSVVTVHESDCAEEEEGDGKELNYVVLEWMEGGSAAQWSAVSANDPGRFKAACRIAIGAAKGLVAAHAKGILHLDVTPENILLTADGIAKLADFGVAVDVGSTGGHRDNPPIGKSGYASPEQMYGRRADARSDIYSLGATFLQLLTGRPPSIGVDGRLVLDPSISPDGARVIQKATEPLPSERYQSAAELLAALESALDSFNDLTLPAYLAWIQRVHGTLKLPVINKPVPLNRVYTALRVDPTSLEERVKSGKLYAVLSQDANKIADFATTADAENIDDAEAWARISKIPYTLTLEYRDRPDSVGTDEEPMTLGDAYHQWRVLVILGDPGSGKTTLARWLARAAAESYASGSGRFQVQTREIDPAKVEVETPFVLGRARLPIFIRAADFAKHRESEAQTLHEYLTTTPCEAGDHLPTYGDDAPEDLRHARVPADQITRRVRKAINDHSALIIIDGLDEIPSNESRRDVRDQIQAFIRDPRFVRPTSGNRIILTSRIVGYSDNSLEVPEIGHVTVERMSEPSIRHFVRSWLGEVERDPARAQTLANTLTAEIFNSERRGLRDLATNPLLAGVLTAVFQKGSKLPDTRVELFQAAVDQFFEIWKERARRPGQKAPIDHKVLGLLEPLAVHIHTHQTTGLISERELEAELTRLLHLEKKSDTTTPEIRAEVEDLLDLIREPIGLLVARHENVYGFIHLAFQEYLAARFLLKEGPEIVDSIRLRLDSPRWREPLLMALGQLALDRPDQFLGQVKKLLAEDGQYGDLLPRGALLVVAALPDLPQRPSGLVTLLVERLLSAYGNQGGPTRFDRLRELIDESILELKRLDSSAVESAFRDAIRRPDLAPAAAAILMRHEWYSRSLGTELLLNRHLDSAEWAWPIHSALREMATPPPPPRKPLEGSSIKAVEKARESMEQARTDKERDRLQAELASLEHEYANELARYQADTANYEKTLAAYIGAGEFEPRVDLPLDLLPLRREIESTPELRDRIVADPYWSRLIVGLYGGLGDHRTVARMREYYKFANLCQLKDAQRRVLLAFFQDRWGEDAIYNIAVHLDTRGADWKAGWIVRPDFHPRFLAEESSLTQKLILPALRSGQSVAQLVPEFRRLAMEGSAEEKADAVLALVILGDGGNPSVSEGIKDARIHDRLTRASASLRDPVARMSDYVVPALRGLARNKPEGWADVLSSTLAVIVENSLTQVNMTSLYDCAPEQDRAYVLAELLVDRFLGGNSEDSVYETALTLHNFDSNRISAQILMRAIQQAPLTRHRHRSSQTFHWDFEQIPPRAFADDDIPGFVLTAIENVDPQMSIFRWWALAEILLPLIEANEDLKPELLAVALRDIGDRSDRPALLQSIAPMILEQPDLHRAVLEMARGLKSPYYKSRALLRLLPLFPDERDQILEQAQACASEISDDHRRAQVLQGLLLAHGGRRGWLLGSMIETILGRTRGRESGGLLFKAMQAASAIASPDSKARAFARLASHMPTADAKVWLRKALRITLNEVKDDDLRCQTIRLLMPQLAAFPALKREAIHSFRGQSPRFIEAKFDLVGPPLDRAYIEFARLDPETAAGWAAVTCSAQLRDILPEDPDTCDPNLLWGELVSGHKSRIVASLLDRAQVDGLTLTRTAAQVLDQLDGARLRSIDAILPYLRSPEPETTPLLVEWLERGSGRLRLLAALLLAERHGLTIETLPAVLDALGGTDDLLRLRASHVIHHPMIVPDTGPTRPTSVSGLPVLLELMRHKLIAEYAKPVRLSVAQAIGWISSDLIHDSPALFRELIELIRHDPGADQPRLGRLPVDLNPLREARLAEKLISQAEFVTPPVWDAFLEGLQEGPAPVRMALLCALIVITHRMAKSPTYGLTPEVWERVIEIIERLEPDDFPEAEILLGGVDGVIAAAASATAASTNRRDRLNHARSHLARHSVRRVADLLTDPPSSDGPATVSQAAQASWVKIAGPDPASKRARLLTFFDRICMPLLLIAGEARVYLRPAAEAEQRIRQDVGVLHLLCDWLRETLERGGPEYALGSLETELLLAVAQGASIHPGIFALREDRLELRRVLVETTRSHPSRVGRCSAVVLLGRLLVGDEAILPAISSALIDVEDVREGALMAATLFRSYSPGFLEKLAGKPELGTGLYHESAVAAFGFGTLLETLGRSDRTPPADRQWILSALAQAVRHPSTARVVHLGSNLGGLPDLPKLDQLLYRMLLRVAGVETPKRAAVSASR